MRAATPPSFVRIHSTSRSLSHAAAAAAPPTNVRDIKTDKYATPLITDEGVKIFQSDPNSPSSLGLTWGSVLWPSGTCLAKYLHWRNQQAITNDDNIKQEKEQHQQQDYEELVIGNNSRVLELGCGTGVVGLTCSKKLGAGHVTLSDSESSLWPILRKSIEANNIDTDRIKIYNLDWRDPTTFLNPLLHKNGRFDLVVAADVLYAGMDGLFARVLASHLPSSEEIAIDSSLPRTTTAIIACPFRSDSPLYNFFGITSRLGLELDRLEDANGNAVGASAGTNSQEAFRESIFVPCGRVGESNQSEEEMVKCKWRHIAEKPTFAPLNHDRIQIFKVKRVSGTSADARSIRRVGRM